MGASVWSSECALSFRLPIHTSVFSAELFALDKAIDYATASPYDSIVIFTDSMSALHAIHSRRTDTNSIQDNIINKLHLSRKYISLVWV
ncbi:reverse transcriptase-like protein, partial [Escherichia coli]|uniref:reverse transcriptase-like protein n=1 Tax=Escherichia coli TaxID=562 RepID=UPI003C6D73FF